MATKRTVKLKGPTHITSMSVGGETFEVFDGIVEVPEEHAHLLASHGFERHTELARAAPTPTVPARSAEAPVKADEKGRGRG